MSDEDAALPPVANLSSLALDIGYGVSLREFQSPERDNSRVDAFVQLFSGAPLLHLTIDHAVFLSDDLAVLFGAFPLLQSLNLVRVHLESLQPFIDVSSSTTTRISSLKLRDVCHWTSERPDLQNPAARLYNPLLAALAEPRHPLRQSLQELAVDLLATEDSSAPYIQPPNHDVLRRLLSVLQQSTLRLERVHVCVTYADEVLPLLHATEQGCVLPDPPRVCCAVLSVLRAKRCYAVEVSTLVLTFARGSVVRTVTWSYFND